MGATRRTLTFTLFVLFAINFLNFYDRQALGAVGEAVKREWSLTDFELGLLGTAFTILYAIVGLPMGRYVDVGPRNRILAVGVAVWGVLTALSGMAWSAFSLFVFRLGVGVGEATCAPAATSLLSDLFPTQRRARAMAIFMLGLPLGLAMSYLVSLYITEYWGWRAALLVAGAPGVLLGFVALALPNPPRGSVETFNVGGAHRPGSPILLVLQIPTIWWIILSGALHNFNAYALGQFLASYLLRYHGLTNLETGRVTCILYGIGALGTLLGGWAADRMVRRRISGRLEVAAVALAASVPCYLLALSTPRGEGWIFAVWLLPALLLNYVYYSSVYPAIQDIVEPSLRGTAMAVYFCAMYLLGACLGPLATGWASDNFARQAAAAERPAWAAQVIADGGTPFPAGISSMAMCAAQGSKWPLPSPEAQAIGLHHALYLIPALGVLLAVVLAIGARTVGGDYRKLQAWMQARATEAKTAG